MGRVNDVKRCLPLSPIYSWRAVRHGWGRALPALVFVLLACAGLSGCSHRSSPSRPSSAQISKTPSQVRETGAPVSKADPKESVAEFSVERALAHVNYLAEVIGRRVEGTPAEREAADYIAAELGSYGYDVRRQPFDLPYGRSSENVIARHSLEGSAGRGTIIVGAHYDSKDPSPGGNDNASGVGVMLEIARVLAGRDAPYDLAFVAFGAEEIIDKNRDHHHYGSRHLVRTLSAEGLHDVVGMMSIDMVGVGGTYLIENMHLADDWLTRRCLDAAQMLGYSTASRKARDWSDHEAFERAGIRVAYHHWRRDPYYHTAKDTANRVVPRNLDITGKTVLWALTAD